MEVRESMKRKKITVFILSILLTICTLIGVSFSKYNSLEFIYHEFLNFILLFSILFFLFYKVIYSIYTILDMKEEKKGKPKIRNNRWISLFENRPIFVSFIILLIGWSIYIIAFYPAIMSFDPSFQILQYFGIDNKYSYYSVLLDKNMIITNHHPVIHTLLLGTCVKIGLLFHSTNLGLFLYSILQITFLAFTLSYTISYMKKINISFQYRLLCLGIYTFIPVFPFYAMTPLKDVFFCCFMILYIIKITEYVTSKQYEFFPMLILSIFIMLFRNNGFHILLLSIPFLLIIKSKNRKKIAFHFLVVIVFFFSYHHIILPYFKVTPSSPREVLSVPFQQTARYVSKYEKEVTEKEREAIDKILGYDTLKYRYHPEKADDVKNKFNPHSTKQDMKDYFNIWLEQFKKHPLTYLEATLNNTYGYYYPFTSDWYIYTKYNKVLKEHHFDYHYNKLDYLRFFFIIFGVIFPFLPIVGLFVNIGFSTWILFFMISYLIYLKKYKNILSYLPSILILLVCFVSPVNTYFRYMLPNIFAMPTMIAIFLNTIKK